MKTFLLKFTFLVFVVLSSSAQSTLITPGNKGNITVPNLTNDQILAIPSPQKGMVAYDISFNCLRVYNGNQWICTFQDTGVLKATGIGKVFGGNGNDNAANIALDYDGSLYVLVNTSFNSSNYSGSLVILKLDPNMNVIWSKTVSNALGAGIAFDHQYHICISGNFRGTTSFLGTTLSSVGENDVFVAKLNADGSLFWAKSTGTSQVDYGTGITFDDNDNVFVTAVWNSDLVTYLGNTAVMKYDNTGNLLFNWTNAVYPSSNCIKAYGDNYGNVYLAGGFFSSFANVGGTTVYPDPNNNFYGYNTYIAKLNSSGNATWVKTSQHLMHDMIFDGNNIYVIGELYGKMTYDNVKYNAIGYTGIYVARLNYDGGTIWMKQYGGQDGYEVRGGLGLALDSDRSVYITGYYGKYNAGSTIEFGTTSLTSTEGYLDGFVAKMNNSGDPQWIRRIAGIGDKQGNKLTVSSSTGNVYVVGQLSGQTIFDSVYLNTNGGQDAFVAVYKQLR